MSETIDALIALVADERDVLNAAISARCAPNASLIVASVGIAWWWGDHLGRQLARQRTATVVQWQIGEIQRVAVANEVRAILRRAPPSATIGVALSADSQANAFVLEALAHEQRRVATFWLDPLRWRMAINPPGGPSQVVPIGRLATFSIQEIADLSGHTLRRTERTPRQPDLAQTLAQVHLRDGGAAQWRAWLAARGTAAAETTPCPPEVVAFLGPAGAQDPAAALRALLNTPDEQEARQYLARLWLRDLALHALQSLPGIQEAMSISDMRTPENLPATLDVVAVRDSQVLALACVVTDRAEEAIARWAHTVAAAQSLGGPGARVAIVSTLAAGWGAVKVVLDTQPSGSPRSVVFGARDLPRLAAHLRGWLETEPAGTPRLGRGALPRDYERAARTREWFGRTDD